MTLVERLSDAKRRGDYHALIDAIPFAKFLGLSVHRDGDELLTTMRYAEHLIGNPALPALHGGTLGALLESAAIFELLLRAETLVLPKTITITVGYLRSGQQLDTHARGILTRSGRRVTNVRVEAWQTDRNDPIAIAYGQFLVMRDQAAGAS